MTVYIVTHLQPKKTPFLTQTYLHNPEQKHTHHEDLRRLALRRVRPRQSDLHLQQVEAGEPRRRGFPDHQLGAESRVARSVASSIFTENPVLNLPSAELNYWNQGLDNFTDADFDAAGFTGFRTYLELFRDQEIAHFTVLK